ncbi:hypothetical protein WJX74_002779 [Apatococcus lobatus]|uniref:Uncharacterized protein n=1 Tax=Apatococcus lobatus TaxID=904363 RepID=A0AAW1Q8Y6_9CHLO
MSAANMLSSQQTIAVRSGRGLSAPARPVIQRRSSVTTAAQAQEQRAPAGVAVRILSALAAAQLALMPAAVSAQGIGPLIQPPGSKSIDERTEQKGAAATIEGSDIGGQDAGDVVDKLKNTILPDVKRQLAKVGEGSAGGYNSSIVKELETVQGEIEGLVKSAEQGGDSSNIKSFASGVEQQVNALKALLGYD